MNRRDRAGDLYHRAQARYDRRDAIARSAIMAALERPHTRDHTDEAMGAIALAYQARDLRNRLWRLHHYGAA